MNIFKRLKNIWKLSEWEPSSKQIEELGEVGRKFSPLTQAPKMAQIIRRSDPLKEILTNEKENG